MKIFHLGVSSCWIVVIEVMVLSVEVTTGLKWFSLLSKRAAVHSVLDYGMDLKWFGLVC
jgi:hypothetical protein